MSEVKRYWKETGQVPREVGETPDGDYVLFADWEAMRAERDAAFKMSKCECGPDECCANLVKSNRERDALREQLREAQRDARRWRWLFNHPDGKAARFNSVWRLWDGKSDWGEAIDAAIAKEPTT